MLRYLVGLLMVVVWAAASAGEPLNGFQDVLLGEVFDPAKAQSVERNEGEPPYYLVKPVQGDPLFQKIFVTIHPKTRQIYRVIVRSKPIQPLACGQQQEKYLKQMEKRYEGLSHAPMEDAEMFQDKRRSAILACDRFGDGAVLVLEYHDEKLDPDVQQ